MHMKIRQFADFHGIFRRLPSSARRLLASDWFSQHGPVAEQAHIFRQSDSQWSTSLACFVILYRDVLA